MLEKALQSLQAVRKAKERALVMQIITAFIPSSPTQPAASSTDTSGCSQSARFLETMCRLEGLRVVLSVLSEGDRELSMQAMGAVRRLLLLSTSITTREATPSRPASASKGSGIVRAFSWLSGLVDGSRGKGAGGGGAEDAGVLQQHFVLSKTEIEEAEALMADLDKERCVWKRVRASRVERQGLSHGVVCGAVP
jgi:hypothetical protein